jgi:hypothetical protein
MESRGKDGPPTSATEADAVATPEDAASTSRVLSDKGKSRDGFRSLFSGKDFTSWKGHPRQPGNWRLQNGILIGSGPAVSHLFSTRDDYKDFHLRVEARINNGGNSGVYFRAPFDISLPPNNPKYPLGYEAQINSMSKDPRKTGSLFITPGGAVVPVSQSLHLPDQWFTLEVIAEGNHIVVKVNGKTTADYIDEKRLYSSGHIALQQLDAQTVVEFRKIEIKELKGNATNAG